MLNYIKKAIAKRFAPDEFKDAERYYKIITDISTDIHWVSIEFPIAKDVMNRILESDFNYWRSLDNPPLRSVPEDISNFREYLRRTYKVAE